MPFYKFNCLECKKEVEEFWSIQKFEVNTHQHENDLARNEPCECGGVLMNQIGLIGMGLDIYKNDPKSNQYWKRGKTNHQVSQIIESHSSVNPY